MPYSIGERVGDYEIVKVLGAGGMGEVYKVRHVISDRIEAMKVLLPNLEGDAELADRFLREIKVQASLSHPNIASLYTASKLGNKLLLLMEYVEGASIEEKLRSGPLAPDLGARYIGQVLDALAYAHAQGVVHRDIKPANIMVTNSGAVKLMDFGIARMKQDRKLTNTGQTVGSLYYMSPEQIRGEELDARSDLYSLGITLYETVTGRRPFEGNSDYSIMAAHLQQNPVPPIQVDPRVPARLNEIILTSIAKEREKRFQKAEAFGNALRGYLSESQPAPVETMALPKPTPIPTAPVIAAPVATPPAPAPGPAWGRYVAIAAGVLVIGIAGSQIPKWRSAPVVSPQESQTLEPVQQQPAATPTPAPAPPAADPTPAPAPTRSSPPPMVQRNLPEPAPEPVRRENASPAQPQQQPPAPVTQPVQQPTPQPPIAAATQPAVDGAKLEALEDRIMKLGIRIGAINAKARSLEAQQAAQGVGLRGDIKSDQSLTNYLMDEAEKRLRSGNAVQAEKSLDKAERVVEKLEKFFGL